MLRGKLMKLLTRRGATVPNAGSGRTTSCKASTTAMQEKLFDRLEGFFPSFLFVKDASGNMMPMMHLTFHNNQGFFA